MTLEKSAVKLRLSFATPKQMRIRRIISFQTQLKTQNHDKKNKFLKKQVPDNENIAPNYKRPRWRVFISATIGLYSLFYVCRLSLVVFLETIIAGIVSDYF